MPILPIAGEEYRSFEFKTQNMSLSKQMHRSEWVARFPNRAFLLYEKIFREAISSTSSPAEAGFALLKQEGKHRAIKFYIVNIKDLQGFGNLEGLNFFKNDWFFVMPQKLVFIYQVG